MILELEEPFKSDWKSGYLATNKENRKIVTLYNSPTEMSGVSYARYKMSVELGHCIGPDYEVDHIDNDKTNDDIDNLQLLTSEENKVKQQEYYRNHIQIRHKLNCQFCKKEIELTDNQLKTKKYNAAKQGCIGNIFCSKSCSAKFYSGSGNLMSKAISDDLKFKIKELRSQGMSVYKIAKKLSLARNTVMKYWK